MQYFKFTQGKLVASSTPISCDIIFVHIDETSDLPDTISFLSDVISNKFAFNTINKLEYINDGLLLSLSRIPASNKEPLITTTYHCVMSNQKLYFIYDEHLDLNTYIDSINELSHLANNKVSDYENMMYIVLLELLNYDKNTLEEIDEECFEIEKMLINNNDSEYFLQVLSLKKILADYKKAYFGLEEVFLTLSSLEIGILSKTITYEFEKLANRMRWLSHEINSLIDYTSQLRDLYHSLLNESMNQTMNFFTVISAIFLPLTLLVGWYGMNFANMPELEWEYGYAFVIFLSTVIVTLLLYIYKKKKYL